jgi:hypothetical protein
MAIPALDLVFRFWYGSNKVLYLRTEGVRAYFNEIYQSNLLNPGE